MFSREGQGRFTSVLIEVLGLDSSLSLSLFLFKKFSYNVLSLLTGQSSLSSSSLNSCFSSLWLIIWSLAFSLSLFILSSNPEIELDSSKVKDLIYKIELSFTDLYSKSSSSSNSDGSISSINISLFSKGSSLNKNEKAYKPKTINRKIYSFI